MDVARLPAGIHVLERGWVHGNVIVIDGPHPAIVDTGYHTGTDTLMEFYRQRVGRSVHDSLGCIALTHTHSDHAGCVAALLAQQQVEVIAHLDTARMVNAWDTRAMWLDSTGQELPRYMVSQTVDHGDTAHLGDGPWTVLHTPGHATGGIAWFQESTGVLIAGDALWQDGFGLLNPWLDGDEVFAHAWQALARIESTHARIVIPGHGSPFVDVSAALARARSRLAYLEDHPDRLQALIVRTCASFMRLARPELSPHRIEAITEDMARALQVPNATIPALLAEIFQR